LAAVEGLSDRSSAHPPADQEQFIPTLWPCAAVHTRTVPAMAEFNSARQQPQTASKPGKTRQVKQQPCRFFASKSGKLIANLSLLLCPYEPHVRLLAVNYSLTHHGTTSPLFFMSHFCKRRVSRRLANQHCICTHNDIMVMCFIALRESISHRSYESAIID